MWIFTEGEGDYLLKSFLKLCLILWNLLVHSERNTECFMINKNSEEFQEERVSDVSIRYAWLPNQVTEQRSICIVIIAILAYLIWPLSISIFCTTFHNSQAAKLKVRKSQNDFFKPTFPPKNEQTNSTLLLWDLTLTCFHSFFGGNWWH